MIALELIVSRCQRSGFWTYVQFKAVVLGGALFKWCFLNATSRIKEGGPEADGAYQVEGEQT